MVSPDSQKQSNRALKSHCCVQLEPFKCLKQRLEKAIFFWFWGVTQGLFLLLLTTCSIHNHVIHP